jgi:cell division protein FtsL
MSKQDKARQEQGAQQETGAQSGGEQQKTGYVPEEQVKKMQASIERQRNEADERAKKAEAALAEERRRLSEVEDSLSIMKAQLEDKELEALSGDPDTLKLRQSIRAQEAAFRKKEREFEETKREALDGLKYRDAMKIAKENELDPEDLMNCTSYADMQIKAKDLVIERLKGGTNKEEPAKSVVPSHVDSAQGQSGGAKRKYTAEELAKMSPFEYAQLEKEGKIDIGGVKRPW